MQQIQCKLKLKIGQWAGAETGIQNTKNTTELNKNNKLTTAFEKKLIDVKTF